MLCKRKFRELKTAVEEIEKALLEKSKINTIWHKVVLTLTLNNCFHIQPGTLLGLKPKSAARLFILQGIMILIHVFDLRHVIG